MAKKYFGNDSSDLKMTLLHLKAFSNGLFLYKVLQKYL